MDNMKFALLDWVEQDLINLQYIKTSDNAADTMTKFHRTNYILSPYRYLWDTEYLTAWHKAIQH
jgi:hypothetical protein